ncbi:MAG: T9SS type A sorting domain-containing protein, partial [Cyclobacteriaceae bacterium]|nr:T9SS type A sorting domain-containing protein [Cyclobacteriaceae bacterium]
AGISFQVKLYESDNKIEFVYQQEAGALSSPSASIGMAFPRYGSPNFISLNNTGASPIASTSVETSSLALKPATGQVYSFVPAKLNQTITFGPLANRVFDPAPFALTATSSSGLPVTYASSNTNVATVAGNLVTLTGQGTITITASQAGDNTFNAAAVVTQSLTITPATLTLVFPQPADKTVGDPPFSLNISTTPSNADLGYEFTNPPVFALLDRAAGTITLQNVAGQIALKVTAGKSGYTTTSITRTFCVNPTKPPKVELLLGATDESLTLNVAFYTGIGDSFQWFRNGVDLNVTSSSRTLSITQPGVYSVSTIKGNCASVPSDGIPVVITDLLNKDKSEINIFPNPTDDSQQVTVDASGHARNGVIDVTVYDMMGRTKEQKSGSGSIQFSLSSYATGYYLFRVNTGTDIISKRIFKK